MFLHVIDAENRSLTDAFLLMDHLSGVLQGIVFEGGKATGGESNNSGRMGYPLTLMLQYVTCKIIKDMGKLLIFILLIIYEETNFQTDDSSCCCRDSCLSDVLCSVLGLGTWPLPFSMQEPVPSLQMELGLGSVCLLHLSTESWS